MRHRPVLKLAVTDRFLAAVNRALPDVWYVQPADITKVLSAHREVLLVSSNSSEALKAVSESIRDQAHRVVVVCETATVPDVVSLFRWKVSDCIVGEDALAELALKGSERGVLLDENDLTVTLRGTSSQLTRKQFLLLRYFAARAGQWLSVAELIRNALDTNHQDDSSVVRVHIHALRKALGSMAWLIETDPLRVRGYRFRLEAISPVQRQEDD